MTEAERPQHDEAKKAILKDIEESGYHSVVVEADDYLPGFAYTIGLYQRYRHPEIICFGLDNALMGDMIYSAWEMIDRGEVLQSGCGYDGILQRYGVRFIEVEKDFYADYAGYALWYYGGSDFPLLQMVWPDKDNRFPWDEDFDPELRFRQPLLDRDTDFKFYEPKNLAVFTTRQILEGKPVLAVFHDHDGGWQFHSQCCPAVEDAKIVSLEQIIKLDPYLNEVFHLQYGWRALRNDAKSGWEYEQIDR